MFNSGMERDDLPSSINFPEEEKKILEFQEGIDAFKVSGKLSVGRPQLVNVFN